MAKRCPPIKLDRALTRFDRNPAEGLDELRALAEKYAKDPSVRHAFGTALMSMGEHWRALDHLAWAEQKEPTLEHRSALTAAYRFLAMPLHAARVAAREPLVEFDVDDDGVHGLSDDMPRTDKLLFERARTASLQADAEGLEELVALSASYPASMSILNAIATARLVSGDIVGFSAATRAALDVNPHDVHALLNAVRLAVLEAGTEAAAAYRDRVREGPPSSSGIVHPELSRAEALAYMDDAEGAAAALASWREQAEEPEHAEGSSIATRLEKYLNARDRDPGAPLWRIETLIAGLITRWSTATQEVRMSDVAQDLKGVPGVFSLVPRTIGWERPWMAAMLTHVLLSWDAPDPPATADSWASVLRRIVERQLGTDATVAHLRSVLGERELLQDREPVRFETPTTGGSHVDVELFQEPIPSGLPPEDDDRYTAAMGALMRSDLATASSILADLHERHPSAVGVEFNLALTERLKGGADAQTARSRLERIAQEHPDYLFAKAQLAIDAIESGDLERAQALLELPQGIERFHVIAFANLHAAQGRLALEQGKMEDVEQILASLRDLVGEYAPPFQRLKAAVEASGRERAVPGAGTPTPNS